MTASMSKKTLAAFLSLLFIFVVKSSARSTGAYQALCGDHQFLCHSTLTCIPDYWRCDHYDDCDNGEDEQHCENAPRCYSDDFMCSNGECIPNVWRCDGDDDCDDGSDEDDRCETYVNSSEDDQEAEPHHHGHGSHGNSHQGHQHFRHARRQQLS